MPVVVLDEQSWRDLEELIAWKRSFRGAGVTNTPRAVSIGGQSSARRRATPPLVKKELATFRIASSTQDGSNKRWTYTAKLQAKTSAGYGGWEDDTNDTADYTLYSENEDQNGSTGTYGNGVSQANLDNINDPDGTFDLQAIPTGTRVTAKRVVVTDGTVEWWIINLPNGVDGACPS